MGNVSQEQIEAIFLLINKYWLTFFLLSMWSLAWKGVALWKASQQKSMPWFIVLLIFNTVGILEILYIYIFSKRKKDDAITS